MSDSATQPIPDIWFENWDDKFKERLNATYRVEEAWEYFKANWDSTAPADDSYIPIDQTFQSRVMSAVANKAQTRSMKLSSTTFSNIADVEVIMGSSVPGENAFPELGTNFIAQQTKWRRFGLLTGFNVGAAVPHHFDAEDLDFQQGWWRKFEDKVSVFEQEVLGASGEDLVGRAAESAEAQGGGTGVRDLDKSMAITRDRVVNDPRYRTELMGYPEPSVLNSEKENNTARNWGYVPGGDPINLQDHPGDIDGSFQDSEIRMFYGRAKILTAHGGTGTPPRPVFLAPDIPANYGHLTGPLVREYFNLMATTSDSMVDIVDLIDGIRTAFKAPAETVLQAIIDEIKTAEAQAATPGTAATQGVLPQPKSWAFGTSPDGGTFWKTYAHPMVSMNIEERQEAYWNQFPHETTLERSDEFYSPIPSQILVWPTLPLDSLMTAEEEQSLGTHSATRLMTGDIKEFWYKAYKAYENGQGAIYRLDEKLKEQFVDNRGMWGGDAGSEIYKEKFRDALEIILDFWGAGSDPEPMADQKASEVAEQSIDSDFYTPEQIEKMLRFKVLKPLDMQCFLMENIDRISELQEGRSTTYTNVVQLYGEPGTTISKINHGGRTEEIRQLLNLSPAVYALLVPYIKLYRVDYSAAIKDEEGKEVVSAKPIAQYEIPIPNFIDAADIRSMTGTDGYGRLRGFGLQSFTWKLDGTQPAEVDNNISANLTFHFQSVNDLFQDSAKIRADGTFAGFGAGHVPNPLDLLISSKTMSRDDPMPAAGDDPSERPKPRCKSTTGNVQEDYDGPSFRIKIVAGWATPPNMKELMPDASPDRVTQLARALETTRISLYLQQVRHDINFNPDGTVQLSIDYQAALAGLLTSKKADILGVRDRDMKAALDAIAGRVKTAADDDLTKEELEELMEKKKALENEDRLKKYRRFLNALYGRSDDGCKTKTTKMYTIQVSQDVLSEPRLGDIEKPEQRAELARRRMSANASSRGFSIRNQSAMAAGQGTNTDLLALVNKGINEGASSQDVGDSAATDMAQQWGNQLGNNDDVYIPYFYLGDLIDTILENHQDIESNESVDPGYMTFLADIDIVNPLVLFQSENALDLACANKVDDAALARSLREKGYVFATDPDTGSSIKKRINIGSIPISLDLFNVWYKNNVIKKSRNRYYLMHFLKDLCSGLISGALKKNCFSDNIVNQVRFDTSVVHFDNSSRKIKKGIITTVDELSEAKGALNETNDIPPPRDEGSGAFIQWFSRHFNTVSGLVLYSTDAKPANRTGNYDADLEAGIYHNYIGSSAGILKSLKFNREDQPYLREAKIQKRGALGAEQLRELYSVSMEMVGNTLFKNGQYTFVWPTLIASDDAYAKLLGLGGYFLITGVDHNISSQGYNVSVRALQEGLRMGTDEAVTADLLRGVSDSDAYGPGDNPAETDEEFRERLQFDEAAAELDAWGDMSDAERDLAAIEAARDAAEEQETARVARENWENRSTWQKLKDRVTNAEAPDPGPPLKVPIQVPGGSSGPPAHWSDGDKAAWYIGKGLPVPAGLPGPGE